MKKIDSANYEKEDLIAWLEETAHKLEEKNFKLRSTREKLNSMKMRVSKMKEIVNYQRERIIELYSTNSPGNITKSF